MKKHLNMAGTLLGPALTIALVFNGCGGTGPSNVTRQFIAALEKGDMAALDKYATPETAKLFNGLMEMSEKMAKDKSKAKEDFKDTIKDSLKGGIVSIEEAITGDKAVVTLKFKDGSTDKVDLVKVDGKWKVAVKK